MRKKTYLPLFLLVLQLAMATVVRSATNWVQVSSFFDGNVSALVSSGGNIYAGGAFMTAGGNPATNIAEWNGSSWSQVGSGMNDTDPGVCALAASATALYAGGTFTTAGGSAANYIARWDGAGWASLGTGMNDPVYALTVSGQTLYAGGGFTTAGDTNANYIAQWNGNAWLPLGLGTDGWVYALAVSEGILYAGGTFVEAGSTNANYIAQWDGNSWAPLGLGLGSTNTSNPVADVSALAVSGGILYVGGDFTTAGGNPANYVAQWDGAGWSPLGSGMNSPVTSLVVLDGKLYAGGGFTMAGGHAATYVAQWDGNTWLPVGSGFNPGAVSALAWGGPLHGGTQYGETLYAGGYLPNADHINFVWAYSGNPIFIDTTNGQFGLSNGQFQFTVTGPVGSNVLVEGSANLQTWLPLATNPLSQGSFTFTDKSTTNYSSRFYRAILSP